MKRFILQTILLFVFITAYGQSHQLAILDLCERNGEINKENLASAIQMAEVAGMPYRITTSVEEACRLPFVLITSSLRDETLLGSESTQLIDFVNRGGVLVAPFIKSEIYFELFGINYTKLESNRYSYFWEAEAALPELVWINEDVEREIRLADPSEYAHSIYTRGYTASQANVLAHFDDGTAAVTINQYGNGKAYALGFELKDVVLRNLMNKDYGANRMYSNGFEPATDVLFLFLRAIYTSNQSIAVYKHTSPGNSSSALLITHDVDSQTGIDSMYYFSNWEHNHNMQAHYFVTTHYFSDELMSQFYSEESFPKIKNLLENGHSIGSHSVGHFPDFANRTLFPEGEAGNTQETYQPRYTNGATSGGTVAGELEVSRMLLNNDIGANVRSFRAGHLLFNLRLINVMDTLGFSYNSTQPSNDVLTNFPFRQRTNSAFSGVPTSVYEIPMTISDASKTLKLTEETIDTVVNNWIDVVHKNNDNGAPTVLLIHPNRGWKLPALERLISEMPSGVKPYGFDAFGDYWLERRDLDFDYVLTENTLQIQSKTNEEISPEQSLIVTGGQLVQNIQVLNASGQPLTFQSVNQGDADLLITAIGQEVEEPQPEQPTYQRLALLDITLLNGETDQENLAGAKQMAEVAGIPYRITTSLEDALTEKFILLTSEIDWETYSSEQLTALKNWVAEGGVLLAPFVKNTEVFDLFGIATTKLDKYRYTLNWVNNSSLNELKWIDDPLEQNIPLADPEYYKSIYTRGYTLNTAIPLAYFDDQKVAVSKNEFGLGKAYAFGVEWKDVILRNLLNKDYKAERTYSNGFEPASDVFMLVLRAVFTENQQVSVYKHTSPGSSLATLLITHDVDSRRIIDTMNYFSNWEFIAGISTHYFVSTHYFKDSYMSAYYEEANFDKIRELIERNHTIGSHSVGHFPDFDKTSVFPEGEAGNTQANYQPYFNGTYTEGGTVYGELEVSRDLLNTDIGANVRSFRAGALAFNSRLINVMQDLGYAFNSSMSANNVLTNFPYQQRTNKAFSGSPANVLEIPLTLTDVASSSKLEEDNIDEVVALWASVIAKNSNNNAPTTLLLSTNRGWKLQAEQALLNAIPEDVITYNFEDYGDYWLDRSALDYDYYMLNDTLHIELKTESSPAQDLSLVVENGAGLNYIAVRNSLGEVLPYYINTWGENDVLITFGRQVLREKNTATIDVPTLVETSDFTLFPNPSSSAYTNLLFSLPEASDYNVHITDINGRNVYAYNGVAAEGTTMHRIDLQGFSKGMYLIHFKSDSLAQTLKLFVVN